MSTSAVRLEPRAVEVTCTANSLHVRVADGREVMVPLAWFPTLQQASPEARNKYRLIRGGIGIDWPELDEDISIEGLLATR